MDWISECQSPDPGTRGYRYETHVDPKNKIQTYRKPWCVEVLQYAPHYRAQREEIHKKHRRIGLLDAIYIVYM